MNGQSGTICLIYNMMLRVGLWGSLHRCRLFLPNWSSFNRKKVMCETSDYKGLYKLLGRVEDVDDNDLMLTLCVPTVSSLVPHKDIGIRICRDNFFGTSSSPCGLQSKAFLCDLGLFFLRCGQTISIFVVISFSGCAEFVCHSSSSRTNSFYHVYENLELGGYVLR